MKKGITQDQRAKIIQMLEQGHSYTDICLETGVSKGTITNVKKQENVVVPTNEEKEAAVARMKQGTEARWAEKSDVLNVKLTKATEELVQLARKQAKAGDPAGAEQASRAATRFLEKLLVMNGEATSRSESKTKEERIAVIMDLREKLGKTGEPATAALEPEILDAEVVEDGDDDESTQR